MTLEKEKRFLLLLSSIKLGGQGSKKETLDEIQSQNWINLNEKDNSMKKNRNELIWRNDLAYIRKHLVQEGYYDGRVRNIWKITDVGYDYCKKLYSEILKEIEKTIKLSQCAINDASKIIY